MIIRCSPGGVLGSGAEAGAALRAAGAEPAAVDPAGLAQPAAELGGGEQVVVAAPAAGQQRPVGASGAFPARDRPYRLATLAVARRGRGVAEAVDQPQNLEIRSLRGGARRAPASVAAAGHPVRAGNAPIPIRRPSLPGLGTAGLTTPIGESTGCGSMLGESRVPADAPRPDSTAARDATRCRRILNSDPLAWR